MKKIFLFVCFLLIVLIIALTLCVNIQPMGTSSETVIDSHNFTESTQARKRTYYSAQDTAPAYNKYRDGRNSEEKDYDNIIISLANEEYPLHSEIEIFVENLNGKTFSCYYYAFIDQWNLEKKEWVRLTYEGSWDVWRHDHMWRTRQPQTSIIFNTDLIVEGTLPGKYRFLVFCGGKTFYSPEFDLVEPE